MGIDNRPERATTLQFNSTFFRRDEDEEEVDVDVEVEAEAAGRQGLAKSTF